MWLRSSPISPQTISVFPNLALPYYCETKPDQFGYTANPMGLNYVDLGLGGFLNGTGAAPNPNTLQWKQLAPQLTVGSKRPPCAMSTRGRGPTSCRNTAQRISEEPKRSGSLLQHFTGITALRTGFEGRDGHLLAAA